MRVKLIAVGRRLPDWAAAAYAEFSGRLPPELRLEPIDIAPGRRRRGAPGDDAVRSEDTRMQARIDRGDHVVALDERGAAWSTREFARELDRWRLNARPVALLVGGPDGLGPACRARADQCWSLSPLTLPHALARVVLAEQLYRAWTVLGNHPYHRE